MDELSMLGRRVKVELSLYPARWCRHPRRLIPLPICGGRPSCPPSGKYMQGDVRGFGQPIQFYLGT